MAAGWAVAGDTPFMWTKQVASNFGGTRNGMIVSWPKHLKNINEVRSQFHHVIDIAPTVLEAAHLPEPKIVNGTPQEPIEGVSMLYTFADAKAESRHKTQYFEIFGNRGIYQDGWFAGTIHRAPWEREPRQPLLQDKWELYDTRSDFSLTNDLAAKEPKKLKEMEDVFLEEAIKNRVLPIDDRVFERAIATMCGRPDLMEGRTALTLHPGMEGMTENVFLNVKNRSLTISADVEMPKENANGVLLCQGGRFGGWSLYVKEGKPAYCYNFLGLMRFTVAATEAVPAGKANITLDFKYDGGGLGKGGTATILVNGKKAGEGRIEHTQAMIFSADETADVGKDDATPVSDDYKDRGNEFTGTIHQIKISVQPTGAASKADEQQQKAEALVKKGASD
jgi:arylsulfatase